MPLSYILIISWDHGSEMETPLPRSCRWLTCRGKNQFVKCLPEAGEESIDRVPENIICCYGMYQPAYDEMLKSIPQNHVCRRSAH